MNARQYVTDDASFWDNYDIPAAFQNASNWADADRGALDQKESDWQIPISDLNDSIVRRVSAYCIAGWSAIGLSDCYAASFWLELCGSSLGISIWFPGAEDGERYKDDVDAIVKAVAYQVGC
ncbi:MAG: hypothetical protein KDB02_05165 [Acidimicrobiales bacterium]|nr:hypothetical protein [Acidimicrobiales bacterium]